MRTRLPRLRLKQVISCRQNSTTALKQSLLKRTFPVECDDLSARAQVLLHSSLSDFLPPAPFYHGPDRLLHPGSHLLYFRPIIPERNLLPDGTDIQHAPDPSYKYRLWAGGEISLHQGRPISFHSRRVIKLHQRITDVNARTSNDTSTTAKVWVNIHRDIHLTQSHTDHGGGKLTEDERGERPDNGLLLGEKRWLVFSQQRPELALDKVIAPPEESFYSVSMKATSALLFRFSALTFNAHAVHLDPEYTRNEYGLPGLLVHGPLTLVLMMEVLARGFDQYAKQKEVNPQRFLIRKVQYRNIAPIFVGEEITICCKHQGSSEAEVAPSTDQDPKHWQVWIQKSIHGQPSVCVRGTVTFGNVGDTQPGDSDYWKETSKRYVFHEQPVPIRRMGSSSHGK